MPISIDFVSNERDFLRGAGNVEQGLEKVSDSLDDVARDSQKSAGKIGKEYDDAARDVDRSTERMERSFKELAASSKRDADQIGDGLDRSVKRGTDGANESIKEFHNEARQNASETFSSFDGSAQSFVDGIQGTLGGIVGSLGPIGAAIGAAGAIGIGLVNGAIENGTADTEAFKASVGELTQALIDAGSNGEVSLEYVIDKLKQLATTGDDSGKTLRDLNKLAGGSKSSFEDLAEAYLGNTDALEKQLRAAKETIRAYDEMAAAANGDSSKLDGNLNARYLWAQETVKTLERVKQTNSEAQESERLYIEAGGPELEAKAQSLNDFADSVQSALKDAGAAWEDYNNDGTTSLDEYNQHIEDQIAAVTKYQENVKTVSKTISEDALNYLLSLGDDAAPILQAYVDAPLAQQQRTSANWDSLGKTSGASYTNALKANIPGTINGPTVVINDVDTSRLKGQIQQTLNGVTFRVNAAANVRVGNAVG